MTLDMYKSPATMVDEIAAVGLRHVGYGIPTEFAAPFVQCWVETMAETQGDDELTNAFGWSLGLISRILVRTINEGSTIVMKAVNSNNSKQLKKALACAPRSKRAAWMLNVTVGRQSISPLIWSINSGAVEAARVIVQDLLTIRADRDRYYYGVDELFDRHPDIIEIITSEAQDLLPVLLDGMIWRSRVASGGYRRVNIYLKHLLVDAEGKFADAMSWVEKMQDPKMVMHGVLVRLTNLVWGRVIYRSFLFGKVWLLFSLFIFLLSQSVMNDQSRVPTKVERIATFACRMFVYCFSMTELIYKRTKELCVSISNGTMVRINNIPVPKRYTHDWHEVVSLLLSVVLIVMFFQEPILYCLQTGNGDFEGSGIFTQQCPEADGVRDGYAVLSSIAMVFYFSLLVDFSALSTRLSAFVLVTGQVLPELGLFLLALAYVVATFGSSIAANKEGNSEFKDIPTASMSLFKIAINMFSGEVFDGLPETGWTMAAVIVFSITVTVFLLNLLAAQLNCAYMKIYQDMVGYSLLSRMLICVEKMPTISHKVFDKLVASLALDEKLEFGEGDIGLPGGIQVLELANENPTTVECIKRFGGSTSPAQPWPEEDEAGEGGGNGDNYERLEKTLQRCIKSLAKVTKKKSKSSSSAGVTGSSSGGRSAADEDDGAGISGVDSE
eukprot:TRINITY_DN32748_c0_g2_i1.p1 TRINITY_DN32748_c0_g2~~TRINITY_DN32748_c0_g2_i1.p1  ORF type:complete len:748 (-),score=128.60 TRINITY_DN32748_c0_g2_i1:280-2283(-)